MVARSADAPGAGRRHGVPLPGSRPRPGAMWRRLVATLKRSTAMRVPGLDAGRRTLCPAAARRDRVRLCVFLARLVGRAGELAGRGDGDIAAYRPGHRVAGAVVLRAARGRVPPGGDIAVAYRFALRLSAATADGMFVPMGFEYATRRPFDAAVGGTADLERARTNAPCDLRTDIAEANALVDASPLKARTANCGNSADADAPVTTLLRADVSGHARPRRVRCSCWPIRIRVETQCSDAAISPLPPQAGAALLLVQPLEGGGYARRVAAIPVKCACWLMSRRI